MSLKAYIAPLIKNWWLLVLACLISATSSYYVVSQQPAIYEARTTLIIGRAVYEPNPSSNELYMNQQLASFYADLAYRQPVREGAMASLGLDWLPEYVVRPLPNSQLIEITVTDINPLRAQAVANELANQLIAQTPASAEAQEQGHEDFIRQQLAKLEQEITETEDEITRQESELAGLNSARQIADAQQQILALQSKLTTIRANYADLLANSRSEAVNTLTVIETAALPTQPVGPNKKLIVALSTAIAVMIAAGTAYLIEYLDDTLKTSDEVVAHLGLPVIGYLAEMRNREASAVYVWNEPRSLIADAFRSLRTNLDFMSVDRELKTILVTSSGATEGKTSIASNLAIVMAQGGKEVILVDADLHKPTIHKLLGLQNSYGLTDLFRGQMDLQAALKRWKDKDLRVLTTGDLPPNPADLLGSKKMDQILDALTAEAEVVIIDGPPLLVSDGAVLASKADGVLFVVRHAYTRRGMARAALEQLKMSGTKVLGVAMNRLPRSAESYYTRYHYYSAEARNAQRDDFERSQDILSMWKLDSNGNADPEQVEKRKKTDN